MFSWLPENVSTFGQDIDAVFYLILYITAFWFVLTEGLLIFILIRYRRGEGRRASYFTGNTLRQAAWSLIPGLIVLILDLWIDFRGAAVWARIKGSVPTAQQQVRVVGKQFNWEMTYPGPDRQWGTPDDLMVENELHVPVGKVIRIILSSKDVIHSFYLPHLRLKQDALPGREVVAWFEATKVGEYEMPCAELCGFGHSGMNGRLYVYSADDYAKWLAENWPRKGN
ncbi:MAG: cytochrome c oxidase subunit II [Deltaproteobacteria bacterium]|nr:cytochrome c oxidase subunit II [Deltaproteobacteria bacterium]